MRIVLRTLMLAGLMSVTFVLAAMAQHHANHVMVVPDGIKWGPVPSLPAGAQISVLEGPLDRAGPITARIKFPANYRLPAHTHPVIEHVTVISGTFNMGTGDKLDMGKTKPLTPGGFAIMQPGTQHFAWTAEETIVQIHSVGPWGVTYVNPADDPRKK